MVFVSTDFMKQLCAQVMSSLLQGGTFAHFGLVSSCSVSLLRSILSMGFVSVSVSKYNAVHSVIELLQDIAMDLTKTDKDRACVIEKASDVGNIDVV